ncbi:MAG: hypothetical protein LBM69_03085, partial [Lachnospiraceae bacterium]|nr:hypothetical protein [Lachnospiraceae bacterium]
MGNIIRYLKEHGNRSFEELAFTHADSLVLCQLSYFLLGNTPHSFSCITESLDVISNKHTTPSTNDTKNEEWHRLSDWIDHACD